MFQSWIPGFDPDNPSNLAFPTWVALRRLPFEHHDQAMAIAGSLGEVIGIDTSNETAKDPRFCVNLKIKEGWITSIELVSEDSTIPPQRVIIDYDKLPMRCRACQSWQHKVRDCKEFQRKHVKGPQWQPTTYHTNNQEKGKHIAVDEEGFQQVRNRRNTRRNIFENAKVTNREEGYPRSANGDTEMTEMQKEKSKTLVEGHVERDPNHNQQTHNLEDDPGCTDKAPKEVAEETRYNSLPENVENRADSSEGMKWSPIKRAGRKRTMLERPDAEEETEEEIGELTCDPDNQVGEIEAGTNHRTGNSDDKEGEDRYNVTGMEKQDVREL